ncbi:hypothetical protein FPG78_03020 [Cardinium endosymbiont of Dermatophagoides farinae]|nr:hypothetical protein FPG78_03020 [Cardinium endosymbiont of Dermatophagoides farinae]
MEQLQKDLKTYGYPVKQCSGFLDEDTRSTLTSFQMHFRPKPCSGDVDAETAAIAKNLVEKYYND